MEKAQAPAVAGASGAAGELAHASVATAATSIKYDGTKKPPPFPINMDGIPETLRDLRRWVGWKWMLKDGRWTKPPVSPESGRKIDCTDTRSRVTLDAALATVGTKTDGIGFVLGDGFAGLDADNCRNRETGEIDADVLAIINELATYAEVSPSGEGVKMLLRAELPEGETRRKSKCKRFEFYSAKRYFTVTGERVPEAPATLARGAKARAAYHAVYKRLVLDPYDAPAPAPAPVVEYPARYAADAMHVPETGGKRDLLTIAREAKNGPKFIALYDRGDTSMHNGDHSAADFALCSMLAFYAKHPAEIDRLFRGSALMRPKWNEMRGNVTYGELTIAEALKKCTTFFDPETYYAQPTTIQPSPSSIPPIPLDALPRGLGEYCQRAAEAFRSHPALVLPTMLATAAAAVGRAADVNVDGGKWRENSNLWLGIIADPGTIKSPTLKDVSAPMSEFNRELGADHALLMDAWEDKVSAAKKSKSREPFPPRPRRVQSIVSDTTIEALAHVLEVSPRVLGRYDELAALFTSMGCYKPRGGPDQEHYKSLHAGAEIILNRKGDRNGDPLIIPNPRISMIGLITTENAVRLFQGGNVGTDMLDRWSFVKLPKYEAPWDVRDVPPLLETAWHNAIKALCHLPDDGIRLVMFSADARARFGQFFEDVQARRRATPDFLAGTMGKFCGQVATLALVLSLMVDIESRFVEVEDVENAILIGEWLLAHTKAARIYMRGGVAVSQDAREVLRWISERGGQVTFAELKEGPTCSRTAERRDAILAELEQAGLGAHVPVDTPAGRTRDTFRLREK